MSDSKLFVLLGKTGDLLSFLPVLRHVAQTGAKPRLLVAKEYAPLLDGVSYVEPIPFDGGEQNLDAAMAQARILDPAAVCVGVRAPLGQVRKWAGKPRQTDSLEKEAWNLADCLSLWREDPPLVIDRRNPEREAALLAAFPQPHGRKKTRVLLHLAGHTSPFPFANLLLKLVKLAFPRWELIDLGAVQAQRVYDLLALYETADLAILCDSAPLHLARACPDLPVVALIQDKPNLWHGSAWRPQYVRFIRYLDFHKRVGGLIDWLEAFVPGQRAPISTPLLHVWSEAETPAAGNAAALATWAGAFRECPIEVGATGRDPSQLGLGENRYPFVKDALRLACMKAKADDILCVSRAWCRCEPGTPDRIMQHPLSYARRNVMPDGTMVPQPNVDLFCFPKTWWQAHQGEMPGMVMGMDIHWPRVLAALLAQHGAVELPNAISK